MNFSDEKLRSVMKAKLRLENRLSDQFVLLLNKTHKKFHVNEACYQLIV